MARAAPHRARFLETFWNAPSVGAVQPTSRSAIPTSRSRTSPGTRSSPRSTTSGTARTSLNEAGSRAEFLTRAMRRVIDEDTARLESGLTVLASVGSTAPFVGLFGTVWGVYHALVAIGMSGQGTLDKVAGPVGEALIMTALGLAVAIPAVLAYNAFVRSNRLVLARLDAFAHDLFAVLTTGSHVGDTGGRGAAASLPRGEGLTWPSAASTRAATAAPMAEINMIPLIDVMLVLLVIFIITAPLLTHAVKVDLPKASSQANMTKPDNIQLAIDARRHGVLERRARRRARTGASAWRRRRRLAAAARNPPARRRRGRLPARRRGHVRRGEGGPDAHRLRHRPDARELGASWGRCWWSRCARESRCS